MVVEPTFSSWQKFGAKLAATSLHRWEDVPLAQTSSHGAEGDRLEAFARPLLLASIVAASGHTATREAASVQLSRGLQTDPATGKPAAIAVIGAQALPEAAGLALSLWFDDHRLWRQLEDWQRAWLIEWMSQTARESIARRNNWVLFGWTIAAFLRSVGANDLENDDLEQFAKERLEAWSRGGGWYTDGGQSTFDYYNSYAFHFYPILIAHLEGRPIPPQYAERLSEYLGDLSWMISDRGEPVRFGRSATYRFAIAAPFSVSALGAGTHQPHHRETVTRVMNFFEQTEKMTDHDFVARGWGHSRGEIAEAYSGELASYWFAKAFSALLVGPQHPYWTLRAPNPAPKCRGVRFSKSSGFLFVRPATGEAYLLNTKSYDRTYSDLLGGSDKPGYNRLVYSSHQWPDDNAAHPASITVRVGRRLLVRARHVADRTSTPGGQATWIMRPAANSVATVVRPIQAVRRRLLRAPIGAEIEARLARKVHVRVTADSVAHTVHISSRLGRRSQLTVSLPQDFVSDAGVRLGGSPTPWVGDTHHVRHLASTSDAGELSFRIPFCPSHEAVTGDQSRAHLPGDDDACSC